MGNTTPRHFVCIMGCGRVGARLAEMFRARNDEVRIIDTTATAFDRLASEELRRNALLGDGTDPAMLKRLGIEQADIFIAVTNGDNRNIMAAQIAKHEFHVQRVICRIYDPIRHRTFGKLGIESICPTLMGAERIADLLGVTLPPEIFNNNGALAQ